MIRLVFYEVGQMTPLAGAPNGDWDGFGVMHPSMAEAEQELREMKPLRPNAFIMRIVMTPCNERWN